MRRNDIVSDLVKKLEQRSGLSLVKERAEDEIAVSSAIETLRTVGYEVSEETAYAALEEVKKERHEASIPGKVKRHYNNIIPSIKHLARRVLVSGSIVGAVSGVGCLSYFTLSSPKPSGYIEGTVIEEHGGNFGGYVIKVNTPQGIYTIKFNDFIGSQGTQTDQGTSELIEKGTLVRFPTVNLPGSRLRNMLFGRGKFEGKTGIMDPDDLEIKY